MRVVKKSRLTPKKLLLIIISAALLVSAVLCAVLIPILNSQDDPTPSNPPEIMPGEAIYLNTTVAYPMVNQANITYILVENENGTFDMTRPDAAGAFWFSYDLGGGAQNTVLYAPPIMETEGEFNYESLYAIEGNDGYGQIYKLSYLCSAIGTPYFSERIELSADGAERQLQLKEYGFDGKSQRVSFAYEEKNTDGTVEKKTHTVTIGGKAISGAGYYFMVDGRNFVYYTSSSYFDYALMGFHSFVKGTLVAEGLQGDSAYEPYLTTDFRHWANEKHQTEGEAVAHGSTVIAYGTPEVPLNLGVDYVPEEGARTDGYGENKYEELVFDLAELKKHPDFQRINHTLTQLKVGTLSKNALLTLITEDGYADSKIIELGDVAKVYKYSIRAVESVITDTEEIETEGHSLAGARYIKVAYFYSVDGVASTSLARHAVLDLESPLLPADARAKLSALTVGMFDAPVEFEVSYTVDNALKVSRSFVLSDITKIYDKNGQLAEKVTEDSYVTVTYYEVINGVKSELMTMPMNLGDVSGITNGEAIKAALIGRGLSKGLNITVYANDFYYEFLRDFVSYRFDEIRYFITSELISAFKFVNASDRDPYYGESFYENLLDTEYRFYGLNASTCETIVEYLGGIGAGEGVTSLGLSGETVAVGLSHSVMDKYGLYAYKIYFELPRGITDITEDTEENTDDMLSDYAWAATLGFTLYISDKKYDTENNQPYRYVGSDMYDLVAKVYGDDLDFLEYSFIELYARRNIVLTDITNIEAMEINFNMDDLYGRYNFELEHRDFYVGYDGEKMFSSYEPFEGATQTKKLFAYITAYGERIDTAIEPLIQDSADGRVSITNVYNVVNNGGKPMHESIVDTVGVSNFRKAFELLQLTRYQGILSDEEKAAANVGEPHMRIRIKMASTAYYYTYDFYRFDDRRVMVSLSQTDEYGNSVTTVISDFYITTFAFKKLASNYLKLLNGEYIDGEIGYVDMPKAN